MRTLYFLMAIMLSIGFAASLDTATTLTSIGGNGTIVAMVDTPDSQLRANGIGNISYTTETILTANTTALGSEFIVDGDGTRWTRYEAALLPDRYGVKHEIDLQGFSKINGGAIIEVGDDSGDKYLSSSLDAIAVGGYGEEVIMRGVNGTLVDQERLYFGNMMGFDGMFNISTSVYDDCLEAPGSELVEDWLQCLGMEEDNPSLFFNSSIYVTDSSGNVVYSTATDDSENETYCATCSG